MSILIMGVSGSGKSTIGAALALRLSRRFVDADALHSPMNVSKMSGGIALDDHDRGPWLESVAAVLAEGEVVVACSALKRRYRDLLRAGGNRVVLIYLRGAHDVLAHRLATRADHFMPASLLVSQLEALEAPELAENAIEIDATLPPAIIIEQLLERLARDPSAEREMP